MLEKAASLNLHGLKVDICVSDRVPDGTVVVKDAVTGAVKNIFKLEENTDENEHAGR